MLFESVEAGKSAVSTSAAVDGYFKQYSTHRDRLPLVPHVSCSGRTFSIRPEYTMNCACLHRRFIPLEYPQCLARKAKK